jgi:hypothetical protein
MALLAAMQECKGAARIGSEPSGHVLSLITPVSRRTLGALQQLASLTRLAVDPLSGLSLRRAIVVIRSSPILSDGLSSRVGNRQKVRLRNPRPIGARSEHNGHY